MFFVIGVIREPIHVHQLIWYSVFPFNWLFSWKSQMFARALPDNCLQTRPSGESRQLLLFAHAAIVFLVLTKLQFSHVPNNKQLQLSASERPQHGRASAWPHDGVDTRSHEAPPRWHTGSVGLYFQPHWAHFQSSRAEKQAAYKPRWWPLMHEQRINTSDPLMRRETRVLSLVYTYVVIFRKTHFYRPWLKKQISVHTLTAF